MKDIWDTFSVDVIVDFLSQEVWSWLIAGLLGVGAARLVRWWRRKVRQLDARSAFGAVESGADVVIELARWSVPPGPRTEPRLHIKFPGRIAELYGPDDLAAISDIEVASIITEAAVEAYGQPPSITAVTQRKHTAATSVIYIGSSLVNPRVANLLDSAGPNFPARFKDCDETDTSGAALCIVTIDEEGNTEELHSNDTTDYAIVARFPRQDGTYDFIVAGIHAEGTVGAGEWLRANWRRFHAAQARSGALLKIDRFNAYSQPEELGSRGLSDGRQSISRFWKVLRRA